MKRNNFFRPKQKGHPNQLGCPFLCLKGVREGNPPSARTCAILLMSTSDSERLACRLGRSWTVPTGDQDPRARNAWGATPAHVRYPLDEHERQRASRLPARSVLNGPHGGPAPPQTGRQDLAFCKLLVAHLLGSPSGGAGTAAAVTERARHSAGRERRFAVSLVTFPALRAYKGKVEAFLKKSFTKKLYARFARPTPCAHVRYSLAQARRSAASLACRLGRS